MEILRDPFWQFIGAFLALIAIIVSIYIYLLQKNKRSLSYEIVVSSELLTTNEELHGKIRILFGKSQIQNIHLLVIEISNDSNGSILPADFYENLSFIFGDETKLLSAEIVECYPPSFKPKLMIAKTSAVIEPTLINSQDYFKIKFLLSQYDNKFKINGRIAGVKSIRRVTTTNNAMLSLIALPLLGILLAISLVLITWSSHNLFSPLFFLVYAPLNLIILIMSYYIYFRNRRKIFWGVKKRNDEHKKNNIT
ncbi:MAG: hypothetical protein HOP27_13910 [Anaerolineales bacterium]|nr:hypothetical protein [Anaerolineales bacterium]